MIQIISPHIDDAIFSLAGMLSTKKEPIAIHYIFSISDWVNPESIGARPSPVDRHTVTKARKEEEESVAIELGHTYQFYDFEDLPIRQYDARLDKRILESIISHLNHNEPCYFPIGYGHTDHKIVGTIGRKLMDEGLQILYYEDMPYSVQREYYQAYYDELEEMGYRRVKVPIDLQVKINLARRYKTQVSEHWLVCLQKHAWKEEDQQYYDYIWIPSSS